MSECNHDCASCGQDCSERTSFIEKPNKVFSVWIYSEVDEKTEVISNYECRGLRLEEYESNFTKEEILQISAEHPELKLW